MSTEKYSMDEVCDRGERIYEERIKHLVEPQENGKFIIIDVETGDYEIDEEHPAASRRMRERRPRWGTWGGLAIKPLSVRYAGRIGEATTYQIGLVTRWIDDSRGVVDGRRQAWVSVNLREDKGTFKSVAAVVDTGFSGHLTLPLEIIEQKGCPPAWLVSGRHNSVRLAGGVQRSRRTWNGVVIWHDRLKEVQVIESPGVPLVGMLLLSDCQLTVRVRPGGEVLIEEILELAIPYSFSVNWFEKSKEQLRRNTP